jgi:hypothetical protein
MPPTLRSVELSFLTFLENGGGQYRELLYDLRDKLNWREHPVSQRPSIKLCLESQPPTDVHCIDISREVELFVYCGGKNPFGEDSKTRGRKVFRKWGLGIERDMFSPANDVPFMSGERLMDMGILEPDSFHLNGTQLRP